MTSRFIQFEREIKRGLETGTSVGMLELLLAAAREGEAGTPPPRLADIVVGEPDRLLVSGKEALLHLVITLHYQAKYPGPPGRAVLPLSVPPAVFGPEASAETEVRVGATKLVVQARLVPTRPFEPAPERAERDYQGTLSVRFLEGARVVFERSYATTGSVVTLNGEASSTEFLIPGGTCPSRECELVHDVVRTSAGEQASFSVDTQLRKRPHQW